MFFFHLGNCVLYWYESRVTCQIRSVCYCLFVLKYICIQLLFVNFIVDLLEICIYIHQCLHNFFVLMLLVYTFLFFAICNLLPKRAVAQAGRQSS